MEIQKPAFVFVKLHNNAHAYQIPKKIIAFFVPIFWSSTPIKKDPTTPITAQTDMIDTAVTVAVASFAPKDTSKEVERPTIWDIVPTEQIWNTPVTIATIQIWSHFNSLPVVQPPSSVASVSYSASYTSLETLSGYIFLSNGVLRTKISPTTPRMITAIEIGRPALCTPNLPTKNTINGTNAAVARLCPIVVYPITIPFFFGNQLATSTPPQR